MEPTGRNDLFDVGSGVCGRVAGGWNLVYKGALENLELRGKQEVWLCVL